MTRSSSSLPIAAWDPYQVSASAVGSGAYVAAVQADSPLLWLRLTEIAGTTFANAGSLGGSATAQGTVTVLQGGPPHTDPSVHPAGSSSDWISYPDNAALDLVGNATYECWVRSTSFAQYQGLMTKGKEVAGGAGYEFRINPSRQLEVLATGTTLILTSTGTIPNDGSFHYLAFTRSGNTYTSYIDGAAAGNVSSAQVIASNAQVFAIGVEDLAGTTGFPLQGYIAEPAVYSTALSAARILAHYNAGK